MSARTPHPAVRLGAGLAALAVAGLFLPSGPAAAAGDSDVDVINTETVQVYSDADGEILTQRVYEQLTLTGVGTAALDNPVEERGLRNLDGFSGYDVTDGVQHVKADVDGVQRLRTVSDYDGELPLDVDITYVLDGKRVHAGDVVGEDGELEVTYTVKNVTAQTQEVSFPDGRGGTVTEMVDVPVPMVGSLTTVLPASFTAVASDRANMAGDGKGGTKMSFTMTLVPPIGSDTATFGYTATIRDGVVPRATLSALPVNPLESPTFKGAATSYQGGADTGIALTEGATEIDGHLLEIRDGANKLLTGLIQLRDGSAQLEEGLVGKAAPGARKLADGTSELNDGLGRLDGGAGRLADGAGRLSDGTGSALTGSQQLHDGLHLISGGLDQLAADAGLPKAQAGVVALQAGVKRLLAGFGSIEQDGTLINGLHQLELGSSQLKGGLLQLIGDGSPGNPGLVAAKGGIDQIQPGIAAAVAPGGSLDQLIGGLGLLKTLDCGPICQNVIDTRILPGVLDSKTNLTAANQGLLAISAGLERAVSALNGLLIPGATRLETGLGDAKSGAIALRDGVGQVGGGLGQLHTGLAAAVSGVLRLASGADSAESGSGELADGLSLINGGAGELADGAGRLSEGAGDAREGSGLIAAGASELSVGLDSAAEGSGRLADGLTEAAEGAPALPEGANRLSAEGMSQLITAGEGTAQEYGKLYAIVDAGSQRAQAESMALGAPDDARGLTAYSFEIKGEDGEGGRNLTRALGAAVVGGLGLGAFGLRRRLI